MLTMGSLFDGISGFPLAGLLNGVETKWVSEIEPFCIKVSSARFPNAKQLGSVTDINGADIEPVDIITFGSPCQDLSVAGKQLGIHEGQRSNLFFEAIRIIKEMRNADEARGRSGKSIRPRFAVWENVPGCFSSNKGCDFQAVLQAFCEIGGGKSTDDVPMPQKGRWEHNGCIVGDGYSLAWKILDAQYCGVPQRRKRIYLVADFGSERAGEILLVKSGVSGHFTESRETREGAATDAERSVGRSCGFGISPENSGGKFLSAGFKGNQGAKSGSVGFGIGVAPTLTAGQICHTVYTIDPLSSNSMKSKNPHSGFHEEQIARTLDTRPDPTCNQGGNVVVEPVYTLQGNDIDRSNTAGCNGKGWRTDEMYTLNTIDRPAVCYGVDCRNGTLDEEKTHTLQAKANGGISLNCTPSVCYRNGGYGDVVECIGTLRANGGDAGYGSENILVEKYE